MTSREAYSSEKQQKLLNEAYNVKDTNNMEKKKDLIARMTEEQRSFIEEQFDRESLKWDEDEDKNYYLSFKDFSAREIKEMIEEAEYLLACERGEHPGYYFLDGWFGGTIFLNSRAFEKMLKRDEKRNTK